MDDTAVEKDPRRICNLVESLQRLLKVAVVVIFDGFIP